MLPASEVHEGGELRREWSGFFQLDMSGVSLIPADSYSSLDESLAARAKVCPQDLPSPFIRSSATCAPISIKRPGDPDESSPKRRKVGASGPVNAVQLVHGMGLSLPPQPYGNHKHRGGPHNGCVSQRLATILAAHNGTIEGDDVPLSESQDPVLDFDGTRTGTASELPVMPSAICSHPNHRPRGVPMGLPPSISGNYKTKWQPELPSGDFKREHEPSQLTIGIEWEVLLDPNSGPYGNLNTIPDGTYPVPSVDSATALSNQVHVYHVVRALNEAGIPAAAGAEIDYALVKPGYARARFPLVNHDLPPTERFNKYHVVRVDNSVADDGLKMPHTKWLPIEVESAVVTIARLPVVDKAFKAVLTQFRAKTNDSYGLHVHIGNGHKGYSHQWMRTTAAMCWAIGPLFDMFHPGIRDACNPYTRGLRYFAKAAHDGKTLAIDSGDEDLIDDDIGFVFPVAEGATVGYPVPPVWPGRPEVAYGVGPQAVDVLSRAHKYEPRKPAEIERVMLREQLCPRCPANSHMAWRGVKRFLNTASPMETLKLLENAASIGGRLSYNFKNLRYQAEKDAKRPRTIEFRQHAGTTDLVAIQCWARVCASIVETCRPVAGDCCTNDNCNVLENNPQAIEVARRAVEGSLCITPYDAYSFLEDIGCVVAYRTYIYGRKENIRGGIILEFNPSDLRLEAGQKPIEQSCFAKLQPVVQSMKNAA
ncbi:hypothetical protein SEUCBS139899_004517 [Sporothrix eucalyptigena]